MSRKPKIQSAVESLKQVSELQGEVPSYQPEAASQNKATPVVLPEPGAPARRNHLTLAMDIAGDGQERYYTGNYKWPSAEKDFPQHPEMRTVQRCFPHARGGLLLVDFAESDFVRKKFEKKAEVLRAKGFRYLIQVEGMTMQDAMLQLREVKCDVLATSDSDSRRSEASL